MTAPSTQTGDHAPICIWRIVDGKPGHESQTAGLVQALGDMAQVDVYDLPVSGRLTALSQWLCGRFSAGKDLPAPDLILGAGHGTHLSVLAAKRRFGGRAVILMQPSLPLRLFDLCLIPEHDDPADLPNVVQTYGVLNTIRPAANASLVRGLVLIGGPSTHHGWDTEGIVAQVVACAQANRDVEWVLTTSRRTPDLSEAALLALDEPNLKVVPFAQTERGWVAERLQECGLAWVSEDSVSMVYEALSSGARVGLLQVPAKGKSSRVIRE